MKQDYFKGFKIFKIIQLIILVIFAATFFLLIYVDSELRNYVYSNKNILTICVFLWAFMIYNVVCIILDFYQLEGHIAHDNTLNKAVYTDSLTGIPNRFGVDRIFEEYSQGKDISEVGCVLVKIANLEEVNRKKGRLVGNLLIVDFSRIIERVGSHYGFVGRNNGNEFLVVIDDCSRDKLERFEIEIGNEINAHNCIESNENIVINAISLLNTDAKEDDFTELIVKLYNKARG